MCSERVSTFLESLDTFVFKHDYSIIAPAYTTSMYQQPSMRLFFSGLFVSGHVGCSLLGSSVCVILYRSASCHPRRVSQSKHFLYQHPFFDSAPLLVYYLCICSAVTTKTKRQWISGAEQRMSIIGESKQDGLTMMLPCKNTTPVCMEPIVEEADLPVVPAEGQVDLD